MRFSILLVTASLALGTAIAGSLTTVPGTYYGGVEDCGAACGEGQGDFNDMVYSLVGSGLTLDTFTGNWYSAPSLSTIGSPFWNNISDDGPGMGVGYCIFGGGNCNIQGGPIANGGYLASGTGQGQVDDVLFSSGGGDVTATLLAKITAWVSTDTFGWHDPDDPTLTLHTIFTGPMTPGQMITFDPSAVFGLWLEANGTGPVFLSDTSGLTNFAFFGSLETPEPDTIMMLAVGLLLFGAGLMTKRFRKDHGPSR